MEKGIYTATVAAADLAKALKFARQPIERRNTIPIISMVRLAFEPGRLTITGTDLDAWCEMGVEAEAGKAFAICMSPETLDAVASVSGGSRVDFSADVQVKEQKDKEGNLHQHTTILCQIEAGDLRAKFKSILPAEDFPETPQKRIEAGPAEAVSVSEAELHKLLADTIPCISSEETRYYLNGCYFHAKEDGCLKAVATDGHRMAVRRTETAWTNALDAIVPAKTCRILHRALREHGNGSLVISGNALNWMVAPDSGDWKIFSKMIDGAFPDYTRVIPKLPPKLSIPMSLGMVKRNLAFKERHGSPGIEFDLDAKTVNSRTGEGDEVSFPLVGAEGAGKVGYNGKYLLGFLQRHSPVVARASGAGDPAVLETEDPDLTQILMPMRV